MGKADEIFSHFAAFGNASMVEHLVGINQGKIVITERTTSKDFAGEISVSFGDPQEVETLEEIKNILQTN